MLKYSPSTFPLYLFFRQNLVTQCILNSQSCTHKDKTCFFSLFLSFSFLWSKTKLISFFFPPLIYTSLLIFFPRYNDLYPSSILGQVFLSNDTVRTHRSI